MLNLHAFEGAEALGEPARALGDLHLKTGANPKNGSALFYLTVFAEQDLAGGRYRGLELDLLEESYTDLQKISMGLSVVNKKFATPSLEHNEFKWVAAMLQFAVALGSARLNSGRSKPLSALPLADRKSLTQQLEGLIEERRNLWLLRNRPGGLEDSLSRLERVRELLRAAQ